MKKEKDKIDNQIKMLIDFAEKNDISIAKLILNTDDGHLHQYSCMPVGAKYNVSPERLKEYMEIAHKHLANYMVECQEHGFCPIPGRVDCDALYEMDYVKKLDELRQSKNKNI